MAKVLWFAVVLLFAAVSFASSLEDEDMLLGSVPAAAAAAPAATVPANATAGHHTNATEFEPVAVSPAAHFCLDFNPSTVPGKDSSPRTIGLVEYKKYQAQLAEAKPTRIVKAAWEAQINPSRLLGKTHGFTCVGCENPLSKTVLLNQFKKVNTELYNAGKKFKRVVGCFREATRQCVTFCYEWAIKAKIVNGTNTNNTVEYEEEVRVPIKPFFPPGPREANTIREYTIPAQEKPAPAAPKSRVHEEDKRSHTNPVKGITVNDCKCSCLTSNSSLSTDEPFRCTCLCPPLMGETGPAGPSGVQGPEGRRGAPGDVGKVGEVGARGSLGPGSHPMETCDCYHQELGSSGKGRILFGCDKDGYFIAGLKKKTSGCTDGLDCLDTAKCCRPCFRISGPPNMLPSKKN